MFDETGVEELIVSAIRSRIQAKRREPNAKPLYEPIFGEERLRTHSIIQSVLSRSLKSLLCLLVGRGNVRRHREAS